MSPTENDLRAAYLGLDYALCRSTLGVDQYDATKMQGHIDALTLTFQLPASHEAFLERSDKFYRVITRQMREKRAALGGPVYMLTLFHLAYLSFDLLANAAFDASENTDRLMGMFGAVLDDLSIENDEAGLRGSLADEVKWLRSVRNAEDSLPLADLLRAVSRLVQRVLTLWNVAERHDMDVRISRSPFYSVFISYSHVDEAFCMALHSALREAGIRVWFAPHDMKPGILLREQVQRAIEGQDKLLLVLSRASVRSRWVETEIKAALHREQIEGRQILFPIAIDGYDEVSKWSLFDADSGRDLASAVR